MNCDSEMSYLSCCDKVVLVRCYLILIKLKSSPLYIYIYIYISVHIGNRERFTLMHLVISELIFYSFFYTLYFDRSYRRS